jgi:hypothetical protein
MGGEAVPAANGQLAGAADSQEAESKERRYPAALAYIRSLAWVRPILILAVLYVAGLALILLLFSQLPTPSQLAGVNDRA